ncbi:MAG TPA: carboxymuconolactone decarboxylase family protein [Micromonosporaceae bacterium]
MRITPLEEPFDDETGPLLQSMMPPGQPPIALFRTFARNPAMTAAMREWGAYCLSSRLSVDMRTREIIIHRVTARCGCEYEFGVHAGYFADRVGLSGDQLRSLVSGDADDECWTESQERAVIRMVDQLHDSATVTQPLWDELAAVFTEPQLLDMLMLAGWYHAISFVARAAQVSLEDGAPTFASLR